MPDDAVQPPLGRSAISVAQLERAARLYRENGGAAAALGITARSFSRLCRQHGILTPYARRRASR